MDVVAPILPTIWVLASSNFPFADTSEEAPNANDKEEAPNDGEETPHDGVQDDAEQEDAAKDNKAVDNDEDVKEAKKGQGLGRQ